MWSRMEVQIPARVVEGAQGGDEKTPRVWRAKAKQMAQVERLRMEVETGGRRRLKQP